MNSRKYRIAIAKKKNLEMDIINAIEISRVLFACGAIILVFVVATAAIV